MNKIVVLCGLPASGKTTFANQYSKGKNSRVTKIYYMDDVCKKGWDLCRLSKEIRKSEKATGANIFVLDGLFSKESEYLQITKEFCDYEIEFHYWEPNIIISLWNDKYRRNKDAKQTIKNMTVDIPNIKELKKVNKEVCIRTHIVERKSNYQMFKDKYDLNDGLESSTWCLGGKGWGWSGDNSWDISAEPQPASFREFDELIEKIMPDISFLKYKRIYGECVTTESRNGRDYYSNTIDGYFSCNVERLYDMLVEYGELDMLEEYSEIDVK